VNDIDCNEPDSAPVKEKEKPFRIGWDCLRKDATEMVFTDMYTLYVLQLECIILV